MTQKTEQENQPQFRVLSQYIKDLSFECPKAPALIKSTKQDLGLQVMIQNTKVDEHHHEVVLKLRGENKGDQDETLFIVEVDYAGLFLIKDMPQEQVGQLLGIEAPSLLFPFARQALMSVVTDGGFRAPTLEPINFHALYMQQQQQQQEQEAPAQTAEADAKAN